MARAFAGASSTATAYATPERSVYPRWRPADALHIVMRGEKEDAVAA